MSAPYIEEMEDWIREHGGRIDASTIEDGHGDPYAMAQNLGIDIESLWLSFVNGLHKGFWSIELRASVEDPAMVEPETNPPLWTASGDGITLRYR